MAKGYGQTTYGASGGGATLSSDGNPTYVAAGVTIDWGSVPANASDTTLDDGTIIPAGTKFIPFGCIMARITQAEVQTVTITGTPTGGTFTLTGNSVTTSGIAYNAAASAVQTAIRAMGGNYAAVTVTGSAGGPYTVTFPNTVGNAAQLTGSGAGLTGGSSPNVSIATTTSGLSTFDQYAPHQLGSTADGRQTLSRGSCFCLNQTVTEADRESQYGPGLIEAGRIYATRLKRLNDAGTAYVQHSVDSTFNTAFPGFRYVEH